MKMSLAPNWQGLLRVGICCCFAAPLWAAGPTMLLEVDATELHRQIVRTRMEIPVANAAAANGKVALWYPKWIPGIHAPAGPIQNVAGLRFETGDGKAVRWRRDEAELYRFECEVPPGTRRIVAWLDYIANQPSVNSTGVDTFGNSLLGVLNWNTCLLYPDGISIDEFHAEVRVRLPEKWRFGTALKPKETGGAWVHFEPASLRTVVDSPLICGERFRTISLETKGFPPVWMHLTSESSSALQIDEALAGNYRKLVRESERLFGGAHFADYHFLVLCSDQVPHLGLEHLASSLNAVGERDLVDSKKRKGWAAYLLPHEYAHSWCGKYRRPAPMFTTNFHSPERTSLLWMYEGLTQYLGEVLTVRSGLLTPEEYLPRLALKIDFLMRQTGRGWRSLEDTAIASYHLRGRSASWGNLRRGQDYYNEGLLIWMEADAIIRDLSDGQRSLDDFCRRFMGPPAAEGEVKPYELAEVLEILDDLAEHDWAEFFRKRVELPQGELALDVAERLGYRLQYSPTPSEYLKDLQKERKTVFALDSLGLDMSEEGKVTAVVPGMPADDAGLAPGMIVHAVNGRKFTRQRLEDAIAESISKREIEMLALMGDEYRTYRVAYAGGPKYLELVRDKDRPDRLGESLRAGPDVDLEGKP